MSVIAGPSLALGCSARASEPETINPAVPQVRITDPDQYQSIVDAEWKVIYGKLDKIVATGANIVLSRLAIGDLATQSVCHSPSDRPTP